VSPGCEHCYAERFAARGLPGHVSPTTGKAFARQTKVGPRWTGAVELIESRLDQPLRWRKPRRIFVNSMSDLFHESLPDTAIDRVFAVMALADHHQFQVLTKRPKRTLDYMHGRDWSDACSAVTDHFLRPLAEPLYLGGEIVPPLLNVWLGVSVEDQQRVDERVPLLMQTPAAVHFVSAEPLLEPIDLTRWLYISAGQRRLGWVIVGGESGPGARRCDVAWIRSIIAQCRAANVACFVKQLGREPRAQSPQEMPEGTRMQSLPGWTRFILRDPKGGDPSEWPADLRVRQFSEVLR